MLWKSEPGIMRNEEKKKFEFYKRKDYKSLKKKDKGLSILITMDLPQFIAIIINLKYLFFYFVNKKINSE